ncbi:hypothetical protein JOH52_007092 [Sinorhizobium meliloti]|nr:hypothetical protein [Sinorhizobium meliloti]
MGIGRKNWLFAGSDKGGERIANILTIIETAKQHGLKSGGLSHRRPDPDPEPFKGSAPGIAAVAVGAGERPIRGCVMARSRFIYTLKEVAVMIGENLELIEEVTANSDNIAEGELVYVRDGSEDGTKGLTENGIDDLRDLLADIRTWDGGIRQFLVDEQCDLEMIERVMADEVKRVL